MSDAVPNDPYASPGPGRPAAPAAPAGPGYGPPPPPAGYGPPPGYVVPPGYAPPSSSSILSDAFSWAWSRFSRSWLPLTAVSAVYTILVLCVSVVAVVWYVLGFGAFVARSEGDDFPVDVPHGAFAAWLAVGMVLLWLVAPVLLSLALRVARGVPITRAALLQVPGYGRALLDSVAVGTLALCGALLFYLPGVVIAFLLQFTLFFALDRGLGLVDSVRSSYRLVTSNLGAVVMVYLGVLAVSAAAGVVPVIGLVVAMPLSLLMNAYAYVRLTGGQPA